MTQQELMALLHYEPMTGIFTWKVRPSNRVKVGDVAGYASGEYIFIRIKGKLHYAHRLAILYMTGVMPPELVDHDNRVKSDNRWDNLKDATPTQNMQNTAMSKNNTSGVTGVGWDKAKKAWCASITVNYKKLFLGYFDDIPAATEVRLAAEHLHGFHPNHGKPT